MHSDATILLFSPGLRLARRIRQHAHGCSADPIILQWFSNRAPSLSRSRIRALYLLVRRAPGGRTTLDEESRHGLSIRCARRAPAGVFVHTVIARVMITHIFSAVHFRINFARGAPRCSSCHHMSCVHIGSLPRHFAVDLLHRCAHLSHSILSLSLSVSNRDPVSNVFPFSDDSNTISPSSNPPGICSHRQPPSLLRLRRHSIITGNG